MHSRRREARLRIVLGLNALVVVGQVAAGFAAGSVGLLADAGHNLTDVAALAVSLLAVRLARRPATPTRSFGWHRSTILAAQANAGAILLVSAILAFEAVQRVRDPQPVEGGLVVVAALVALAVNGGSVLLLREDGHDLNMRSALLHLAGDALASLGVAIAGAVIWLTDGGALWLDPLSSLLISVLIAVEAVRLLRATTEVLLEAAPAHLDLDALGVAVVEVPGVEAVHDVHAWTLSSDLTALSAHLVMEGHPTLEEAQGTARVVRGVLERDFAIAHATLELECEACPLDPDPCQIDAPLPEAHRH